MPGQTALGRDTIALREDGTRAAAVPVLFIACIGRSGSTLLDRSIGMHDGFCSVGELRFIWERAFAEDQLCGCESPFSACTFWRGVSRRLFDAEPADVDVTKATSLWKAVDEVRALPWLLQSRRPAWFETALRHHGQLLERLYKEIKDVSRAQVIVDSSGTPTHGLILSRLQGIELHVLHLIRDSRAVAFSWKRVRSRPEIHWANEDMPIEPISTSALRWMRQNVTAELLAKRAASYSRLRYEDFVVDPQGELTRVLAPFPWLKNQESVVVDREIDLDVTHTVSGNPMRFARGRLRIKADDEWRQAMSADDRRLVTAITWPLLRRYGYPLR